jgi:hypothetical protein
MVRTTDHISVAGTLSEISENTIKITHAKIYDESLTIGWTPDVFEIYIDHIIYIFVYSGKDLHHHH